MASDKDKAKEEINKLVNEAYSALLAAEKLANEHNVGFGFSVAYGMGGFFYPDDGGWCPSSQEC